VNYRRVRTSKKTLDAHLQICRSEIGYGTPIINDSEPTSMRRVHARYRLLNIAMIRYCGSGMIGLCGEFA
jgi:hypothetical protein